MLGDSAVLGTGGGSSGDDAVAAVVAAAAPSGGGGGGGGGGGHDGGDTVVGGGGSNSGDDERGRGEEGDRSFGGNRWPRQETLALLKIRADMDVAFRDASVKGPLWEEVSRKLAELGFHRNAKKCKEKFENVYKYHKRTKEGRSGKSDGKTYRFFDQLQALETNPSILSPTTTTPQHSKPPLNATPVSVIVTTSTLPIPQVVNTTVPSTTTTTTLPIATTMPQAILNPPSSINLTIPSFPPPNPTNFKLSSTPTNPPSFPNNIPTDLFSNSSSSSTSSDDTLEGGRHKRKRKWKDFFERLMKEVIEKQEELQRRFLEAIEKREMERVAREEAWRMQEMQRINREREILAQERSIAAAKDAAVMSFLQKIAEQQNLGNNSNFPMPQASVPLSSPPPPPQLQQAGPVIIHPAPHQHQHQHQQQQQVTNMEIIEANNNNNGENLMMQASSSRWPKVEVQALINLRTNLETKYQENGPKGPLWEEISSLMRKIGYNRSAKRCKEKWENINKYFKKVKESNKKRPEDSKTCPYFHLLDALYKEKSKHESPLKLDPTVAPLMVRPEQQWPPQLAATAENNDDSADHRPPHQREDEDDDGVDDEEEEKEIGDDDEEEDDDDEGGNNYEIVASKPASSVGASAE